MKQHTILIPAYQPGAALPRLVRQLTELGFRHILVVDDGSEEEYQGLFSLTAKWGAEVVHHEVNRGKGAALRTGIEETMKRFPEDQGIITADADGQHLPKDILVVSEALAEDPLSLVLGVRDFDGPEVPWKSRFGNRATRTFFRLSSGRSVSDTQTGLRGFSASLYPELLKIEGNRYEYEMHMLEDLAEQVPFHEVPIETVYENKNAGSHFRPIMDSIRVYGRPLKFALSSLSSSVLDILLFWLLLLILPLAEAAAITTATVIARLCSGAANFLINHYFCFRSDQDLRTTGVRYGILFFAQMALSAALVNLITSLLPAAVVAKMLVDTALFFLSYHIQKRWVFRRKEADHEKKIIRTVKEF